MDTVILKVMNFAQKLVDADRASLFLVDSKTQEIYARIFDISQPEQEGSIQQEGTGTDGELSPQLNPGHVYNQDGQKEIRLAGCRSSCKNVSSDSLLAKASLAMWH